MTHPNHLALGQQAFHTGDLASARDHFSQGRLEEPELDSIYEINIQLIDSLSQQIGKSVDIIIPVYNALKDVKRCLQSVDRSDHAYLKRVFIINDGSDHETTTWLENFCQTKSTFELINNSTNIGYTKTVNKGLRLSQSDYVITLNSDTVIPKNLINGMLSCFSSDPQIGVVGPLSNAASWQNIPNLIGDDGKFAINKIPFDLNTDQFNSIIKNSSRHHFPKVEFVNGFCFMIRKDVLNNIGLLDEDAFPMGYGEENDLCLRVSEAGYKLAIADNCYVFHAKSKSFGSDNKAKLSQIGHQKLIQKHGDRFIDKLEQTKQSCSLNQVRRDLINHLSKIIDKTSPHDLRILFLLPVKGGSGGAHSVIQEVIAMRNLHVDAKIAILEDHLEDFEATYGDLGDKLFSDIFIHYNPERPEELNTKAFDCVVATIFSSVKDLKVMQKQSNHFLPCYYVQDYEPLFYKEGTDQWIEAKSSYSLISNCCLFAKTHWIANEVYKHHSIHVEKVRPSLDEDIYYSSRSKQLNNQIVITAMIRPQTPRRGAARTMILLSHLKTRFKDSIKIRLFGCETSNAEWQSLYQDFEYVNHGILTRLEVAEILKHSTIFIDLSDYQAFGRTGFEAMACGCIPVLPIHGGAEEFASDGKNSLLVDTFNIEEVLKRLIPLIENPLKCLEMRLNGIENSMQYSKLDAAQSELRILHKRFLQWKLQQVN